MSWNNIPDWASRVTKSILNSLKAKDCHTYFHCLRVGRSARLLGRSAGLNGYEQLVLEYSGLFHDVGKIGIPDEILFKPKKLSREEFHLIKLHPLQSIQIIDSLTDTPFFKDILPAVELHHEKLDGTGYPYGLEAKDIPLLTRIVSIVDSVDAMLSTRPYRKGLPMEKALSELKRCSGTQFDEDLVKIYMDAYKFWSKESKDDAKKKDDGISVADALLKIAS